MGPIDYVSQLNAAQDPANSFLQSFQGFSAIRAQQQQQQQQQQQLEQQQRIQQAYERLRQPGATAKDYADLAMMLPEAQAKSIRESFALLNTDQQQNALRRSGEVFSALVAGKPDIAVNLLTNQAEAMRNSGNEEGAKFLETWREVAKVDPESAQNYFGMTTSQIPGGEKVVESALKLAQEKRAQQMQPSALRKSEAEATSAEVTAKYAEPKILADMKEQGWKIENIKSEIGYRKEQSRIAAMNAALNREGNDLKRQELRLKVQEAQSALDEKARAKVADVQSATSTIDNLINTVDRIKSNPRLNDVVGSIEGRMPVVFSDEASDAVALIDTLGSQVFMSQIPAMKGTGALSEKEGEKLQTSLQNLSRKQSEKQFRANLDEVQRLMLKARKNVESRYGVKGGVPDTPSVQTSPGDIDALVKKYGGG